MISLTMATLVFSSMTSIPNGFTLLILFFSTSSGKIVAMYVSTPTLLAGSVTVMR